MLGLQLKCTMQSNPTFYIPKHFGMQKGERSFSSIPKFERNASYVSFEISCIPNLFTLIVTSNYNANK